VGQLHWYYKRWKRNARSPYGERSIDQNNRHVLLALPSATFALVATGHQRSTLLVVKQNSSGTVSGKVTPQGLDDPEGGKRSEGESRPVNKVRRGLLVVDGEQGPSNGNRAGNITFRGGEGVGCRGGLQGQKSQEDKDFGENASLVGASVDTESLEGGQENEDGSPTVPKREWEVDPEFIVYIAATVILLDDVVDVADARRYEQRKDESDNIVLATPYVDVDTVERSEKGETPTDTIDDGFLALVVELVDDRAEQQEVDQ
jgi:hypothetical protein